MAERRGELRRLGGCGEHDGLEGVGDRPAGRAGQVVQSLLRQLSLSGEDVEQVLAGPGNGHRSHHGRNRPRFTLRLFLVPKNCQQGLFKRPLCLFYGSIPEKCGQCGKSALQLRDQLVGEIRKFISDYPVPLASWTRPDAVQEITHRYLDPGGDAAVTGDWRPPGA
ncbi:hypothetical protein Scani_63920 [Streptomyces caniferus]|uniref:Uncharacterized protein n=1 Tax=Streptomyces caniferus TaxID=285557 RepID=A0A640SGX6_9ACTN|nr:hypothetical protein Scani_63920 [Streptomyces caniferus]